MEFHRVGGLEETLDLLSELGPDAALLAGGTDLMVQYLRGETQPGALIHIEPLAELRATSVNGRTTLGCLVTHRALGDDEVITERHPALAEAARTVGGWQTQAVGTIGGNICNASPAADTAPPLLVADAHVTLRSASGERRLSLAEFWLGRRSTARRPDEVLASIDLEPLGPGEGETYVKLGRRGAMEVAIVGMAMRLGLEGDRVRSARIGLCSVAPTPRRVEAAEEALIGSDLGAGALDAATEAIRAAIDPIDDARASAAYRSKVVAGLLRRAVDRCRERAI